MSDADQFRIWESSQPKGRGVLDRQGATVKPGPQVCKTVSICDYGDSETGMVSKRELRVATAKRLPDSNNFDFANPVRSWTCENEELDNLIAFLNSDAASPGRYRLVPGDSPAAVIADLLESGGVVVHALATALADKNEIANLLGAIVSSSAGEAAAAAAIQAQRRRLIAKLQTLAGTSGATETQMQALIGDAYWLFGGRYIGIARRDLAKLDQHDIPLMGVDGTLHIVELKGPCIPRLVRQHRSHWIVGDDVHEAVSQAMNYLRGLDEQGPVLESTYRNERGEDWDMRRVHATVVIGHPAHVMNDGADERLIEQTIRSYNAYLSRVEVITYKTLLGAADQALRFTDLTDPDAETATLTQVRLTMPIHGHDEP